MSPLCNFASNVEPFKWAKEVQELYDNENPPDYVRSMVLPLRNRYGNKNKIGDELLTSLAEVKLVNASP